MIFLRKMCILGLLLAGWLAVGCSSSPERESEDSVLIEGLDAETIDFPSTPQEGFSFRIASNKTWSIAKSNLEWLAVSPMNGGSKLPATVTLTAEPNDDLAREGGLTLYAGAYSRSVIVRQEAFPIVPEITLSGLDGNTVEFAFTATDPVAFSLYSNVAWHAELRNLDWVSVEPLAGERKQSATVTVTPTPNEGPEREGSIVFSGEGLAEPVTVTVRQAAYVDDPIFNVLGAESAIAFANVPDAPVTLQIQSNRAWTVEKTDLDWLDVTPASGTPAALPVDVRLTAENNASAARSGRLTFVPEDPALQPVAIEVTQAAAGDVLLAWWTLADDVLRSKDQNSPNWTTDGYIAADRPAATTAFGQWHKGDNGVSYTSTYVISSDGNGHYAIKTMWTGDNLEFSVPVKHFAAGTTVRIRFASSGTGTAPKYWFVEYYDQGVWKPTSVYSFTYPQDKSSVEATYELTGTNKVTDVDEYATFTEGVDDGVIRWRIRCTEAPCKVDGKARLTAPATAGTIRLRQQTSGEHNGIGCYIAVP